MSPLQETVNESQDKCDDDESEDLRYFEPVVQEDPKRESDGPCACLQPTKDDVAVSRFKLAIAAGRTRCRAGPHRRRRGQTSHRRESGSGDPPWFLGVANTPQNEHP